VTAIGGGDVSLPTSAARGVDSSEVKRAILDAIALGITLFEVASDADSEKLVGDSVRAQRARDHVVTAIRVPVLAERPGAPRRDVLPERLPAGHVQRSVEASLRATRLDALPLAQLPLRPAWLGSHAWPELVGTCARLIREGKVLAWGALLDELDQAAALVAEPWLASISVVHHLCERAAEPLQALARPDLAVLARQPLAGGALGGALGPGVHLPARDDRQALDAAALERIAVAMARLAPLVEIEPPAARSCDAARKVLERGVRPAHVECRDVAELALRFILDRGVVALPRLHRADHLPAALAAAAAPPLSEALIERLARLLDEHG
jgi:aryl-alcohol dehydrogenase-like predicted oxidoreductase